MRLLDLFCGAGGAAVGYARAGFEVVGVDRVPQRNYPFEFVLGDALEVPLGGFDVVHASPPCQPFSRMSNCRGGLRSGYEDLVAATRERLVGWGGVWVMENVPDAPLLDPVMLCGMMFGLRLYRHRLFESSVGLWVPPHSAHVVAASRAGHWVPGTIMSVAGHVAPIGVARAAMGIGWMTRDELTEAVPPAYTEFLGRQLAV